MCQIHNLGMSPAYLLGLCLIRLRRQLVINFTRVFFILGTFYPIKNAALRQEFRLYRILAFIENEEFVWNKWRLLVCCAVHAEDCTACVRIEAACRPGFMSELVSRRVVCCQFGCI